MDSKNYDLQPDPRTVDGKNCQNIYLSVVIGNGQIGGNYVTLNGAIVAKGDLSQLYLLGTLADLKGKTINVQTNVMDINTFTDMCVITTTFCNENNDVLFKKTDNGSAPTGGIAIFKGDYQIQ